MKTTLPARIRSAAAIMVAAGLLAGCATSGNPKDPVEDFNRVIFALNEGLDTVLVKPVAMGYEAVLPSPIRTGVGNVFGNIEDVLIGVNNLLQGKVPEAFSDLGRVAINTTVGLLGIFDFASNAGLEKHEEDFGQTFGRWGVGNGAYLVVPVFGPRTVRDTVGLVLNIAADPVSSLDSKGALRATYVLRLVHNRANALPADKVIEEAALDKYSYMRDAYLQRRRSLIYDGDPPREREADLDASAEQVAPVAIEEAEVPVARFVAAPVVPLSVLAARTEQVETK